MGVRIGEIRGRNERISFRDWVAKGYCHSGRYPIRVVFPPQKFPTFTFIFQDEKNSMEVRLSLKAEKVKEVMRALGIELKKADLPALILEVEEGDAIMYGLDVEKETTEKLVWRGSYWIRRNSPDPFEGLEDNF